MRALASRDRIDDLLVRIEDRLSQGQTETWRSRMGELVDQLAEAFAIHIDEVEAPDGMLVEITDADPRLTFGVLRLRADHEELFERLNRLRRHQDFEVFATDFIEVSACLRGHVRFGSDLLFKAFGEDLGGG